MQYILNRFSSDNGQLQHPTLVQPPNGEIIKPKYNFTLHFKCKRKIMMNKVTLWGVSQFVLKEDKMEGHVARKGRCEKRIHKHWKAGNCCMRISHLLWEPNICICLHSICWTKTSLHMWSGPTWFYPTRYKTIEFKLINTRRCLAFIFPQKISFPFFMFQLFTTIITFPSSNKYVSLESE